jgi:amidophosphoribosyltransferase
MMFDKFREECGVFGIFGHPEAANMTYLGLYALQHRGQESAGIATADHQQIRVSRAMGYVADTFDNNELSHLPGPVAIGHVRYSTAGESQLSNAQPILIDCAHGQIAICHNGNLVNAGELRDELVRQGSIFQSGIAPRRCSIYARSKAASVDDAIADSVAQVQERSRSVPTRTSGRHPRSMARPSRWAASAMPPSSVPNLRVDLIGATYVRDIEPEKCSSSARRACAAEAVSAGAARPLRVRACLLSRPDSYVFGRRERGSHQSRPDACPRAARRRRRRGAVGLRRVRGDGLRGRSIPLRMGLIRNHYRPDVHPAQSAIRNFGVRSN